MLKKFMTVCAVAVIALSANIARAQDKTIVEIAASDPQFSTLVTAVKAAGLVDTLNSAGPFTVFAPTNDAFAKVPKDALTKLLANKEALKKVLLYHVVSGKVLSTDLKDGMKAKTAAGPEVTIKTKPAPMVNNAKIIKADIAASNGVIHVIDTVIMPKAPKSGKMTPKM
jgi:hypothetical protein